MSSSSFSCLMQKLSNILAILILFVSFISLMFGIYRLYIDKPVQEWLVVLMIIPLLYLPLYIFSTAFVIFLKNYIKEMVAEAISTVAVFMLLPIYLLKYFEDSLIYTSVPFLITFHILLILSKECGKDIVVEDIIKPEQFKIL